MSLGLGLVVVAGGLAFVIGWVVGRLIARGGHDGGDGVAWSRLPLGAAAFIAAGVAQNFLVAPVALLIHGPHGLQPLVPSSAAEALYYGLAAGVVQELAKLAAIQLYLRRDRLVPTAVAVGLGFALVEILFVGLPAFSVRLADPGALALPVLERFSATLFHIGSALIICAGLLRRRPWAYLLAAIVLHAIPDSGVELMAALHVHATVVFEVADLVFSLIVLATGCSLVRLGPRRHASASP